ncbi:gliding motility-associated C-terminal domain-containing protein [Flavobacterium sp.]|uniref:T9SS type B sorting domain-containing protein n=1 Tax=Flavobacterium sp. TaxID=239 RepID=UPI00286D0025|nr:gliding motility-associated C-terminal domain-containing protein [Flavobacterium sp.]
MKHKITIALFKILFGFFVFILPYNSLLGQTIAVLSINNAGKVCASNGSNHNVVFDVEPLASSFPAGTTFSAELSSDNFTNFVVTSFQAINPPTGNRKTLTFQVPNTLVGSENYKIRIKAIDPSGTIIYTSPQSGFNFPAYYKSFISNFNINGGNPNANICSGGNITLAVDSSTPTTPSPLLLGLNYIWEFNTTSDPNTYSVIPNATQSTITVNSVGFYKAKIDYGSCTDGSQFNTSNVVQVTQTGGNNPVTITSTTLNPVCSGSGTVLSVPAGSSYKWFKDNVEIVTVPPATTNSYNATQSGVYFVKVSCGGSTIESDRYTVIIKSIDAKINRFVAPQVNFVLLGESLVVTASSTATTPTYEWFFEGNSVLGQTSNIFTATLPGNYSVKVSEAAPGCLSIEEIKFILKNGVPPVNIPNVISPNNDGINDTWIIPQKYLSGSKTEIQILTAQGKVELTTTDYKNDWPSSSVDFKNTNPIYYYIITTANQETKMGSITVIK